MYKMLQLFVPELYLNKAVQTQKPYAILIPLLQMVVNLRLQKFSNNL